MKQIVIPVMLILASMSVTSTYAAQVATGSLQEMTYELPADGGKLYLTLAGSKSDQRFNELRGLLGTHPEFATEAHYTPLVKESKMHAARYASEYRDYPTVRVQTANGTVVREWTGNEIPTQDDLIAELKAECFRRRKVDPQPQPDTSPDPQPQPIIHPIEPVKAELPVWLVIGAFAGGLALRAVQDLHAAVKG